MPQVDVIIPVYNTPHDYTRAALDSALAQTVRDIRVMVVNDGSNEETTARLEALVADRADARVRYLKGPNRGLPGARNVGIHASDSPFVALLDSDDIWYEDKLERQLRMFAEHSDLDLVHCCSDLLYGADMSGFRKVPPKDRGTNGLGPEDAVVRMLRGNFVGVNTAIFRRASAARVGFFDEQCRTLEDKDLWVRMLLDGQRFGHFLDVVAIYRKHPVSLSRNPEKMRDGRLRLIGKMDALQGTGIAWLDRVWPALRRELLQHAYQEVTETYLETGQYLQALKHAMPWYSGLSTHAVRLGIKSALGALGLRPTP